MSLEDQNTDRKSLRTVIGKTVDWDDVARACVCFANGAGGRLLIGIEDGRRCRLSAKSSCPNCWIGCASVSAS